MTLRPTLWWTAAALAGMLGVATVAAGPPVEAALRAQLGDPAPDRVLDRRGVTIVAQLMTVDPDPTGRIISYEYTAEGNLFVGYQRLPATVPVGPALSPIRIEVDPFHPGLSRLAGRWRRPRARWVQLWHAAEPFRLGGSGALGLLAVGLFGVGWRRLGA